MRKCGPRSSKTEASEETWDFWKAVCRKTQAPLGLGNGQNKRLFIESFSFLGGDTNDII